MSLEVEAGGTRPRTPGAPEPDRAARTLPGASVGGAGPQNHDRSKSCCVKSLGSWSLLWPPQDTDPAES